MHVCIPDYGPLTGRRWRHSDKCACCRGQCQDAEPQPHGLPCHPFSNRMQRWAVKTASRHCEVPKPRKDPLVGKEKSEPLRPLRSQQEYGVYLMTTVYVPTERREMAECGFPPGLQRVRQGVITNVSGGKDVVLQLKSACRRSQKAGSANKATLRMPRPPSLIGRVA